MSGLVKMKKFMVMLFGILIFLSLAFAQETFSHSYPATFGGGSYRVYGSSVNPQFNNPSFLHSSYFTSPEIYWPDFDKEDCLERQDFIMQIPPGGCSPAVVTSDLLEEQNVPVFCKVSAIQVNPLIDVSKIRALRFTGKYPEGVSSVSYFPARASIQSGNQLESSPVKDNLGYAVIVLSKNDVEGEMPDFVEGNISAVIDYDAEGAFGIGRTNFYVNEISNEEWLRNYEKYSFWNGKAYLRAESIEQVPSENMNPDQVTVSVYRDKDSKQATVTLREGETSRDIYLSGFYCAAGMNIKLDEIKAPVDTALIQISDSTNSKQIWVSRGDRILDGKCWVTDLNAYSGGGNVDISCRVQNGRFQLGLNPGKANLEVDGVSDSYSIGNEVKEKIFLAYAGQDSEKNKFVILIKDENSESEAGFAEKEIYDVIEENIELKEIGDLKSKIRNAVKGQYRKKVPGSESDVEIKFLKVDDVEYGILLEDVQNTKDKEWDSESSAKKYYDEAIDYYEDLVELYPSEKSYEAQDAYAAQGLYEAAYLSKVFGQNGKANDFFSQLIRDYPNSDVAISAKRDKELLTRYDSSQSKVVVYMNNQAYFFDLLDVKKPGKDDANAVFLIDGKEYKVGFGEVVSVDKLNFQLKEINDEYVLISYAKSGNNIFGSDSKTLQIKLKEQALIEDSNVKLLNINLKKQAKFTITPKSFGPRTESNFKFKIGIEKRDIKLSPDRTKEMINEMGDKIKKWSEANSKLGKVVEGLKGACYATSAALAVKTLVEGFSGEAMARKMLMTGSGGWNDFCEDLVGSGKTSSITGESYSSVQSCLLGHNDKINEDIELYEEKIKETNSKLEEIQSKVGIDRDDVFDLEGQADAKKIEEEFEEEFEEFCSAQSGSIGLPGNDSVSFDEVCSWDTMTHEQRKDIMTMHSALGSGSVVMDEMVSSSLGQSTLEARNYQEYYGAKISAEEEAKDYGLKATSFAGEKSAISNIYTVKERDKLSEKGFEAGDNLIRVFIPSKLPAGDYSASSEVADRYALIKVVKDENSGNYVYDGAYSLDGVGDDDITKDVKEYLAYNRVSSFKKSDEEVYKNKMLNSESLKVKYFERTPYKGLPAEVPFGPDEGWYVHMTYVLSGFGKPYDESGRAVNYYICNVGTNGLIEFKKSADDICRYYNGNVNELSFPGMSSGESRLLISRAQQAIAEASRQYGQKTINIGRNVFGSAISFAGEEGRCSDFMSPQDCHLLFNVCDPVICPTSRCDLGGKFRVDNVIQTGVIGSLMLCLPNINEGIFVPVCLSGVHAGIEGYLSILNSTQACLRESIESGRNIGICDEIKSIYLCEFFWKQATPLVNVIIPRLIESFFSQGVRGGGEYLTVQSSWENTKSAIDYFKNEYAVNSMKAFTERSTDEIGSDVCSSFMSVRYPDSENYFDNLLEPDSPVQYSAWFSENTLTTATIPATSHYKVYYHIYSGNDQGVYYSVYLRDLPESGYIYSSGTHLVDSGYIAKGSQVDEARDFTAVSGYKQLCISVNGQEECGFGKVSTSYILNSISDAYVEEQTKTGIKSEEECVAGTPSLISALQPNLQSGADEVIEPQLYKHGIIRICSTENPGKEVLSSGEYDKTATIYDKWKDVGYCDDPTIRCWLDTDSVQNVVKDSGVESEILNEVNVEYLDIDGFLSCNTSQAEISWARKKIQEDIYVNSGDSVNAIESRISEVRDKLIQVSELGAKNVYRSEAFLWLGRLYKKIASALVEYELRGDVGPAPQAENVEDLEKVSSEGLEDEVIVEPSPSDRTYELIDGKIFFGGVYTGYYVVKRSGGYLIYREIAPDKPVGLIIGGKVSFSVQTGIDVLENYKLEGERFVSEN